MQLQTSITQTGAAKANFVLDALMAVAKSILKFPGRGSYPKELVGPGIRENRQTFFKP
ncbi:hypothetical protein [Propionivibrio sp.]|uniref:hypothetical protein n=1 Tax=Propionivibrio sp. TaxID=2212460 RepID=UPI0025F7B96D|nr:hypothetical protein [Propionivibrio sp.]